MQDILSLYLQHPHPQSLILIFLLGLIRFGTIVTLAPFFGARLMPIPARIGFAVALTAAYLPIMLINTHKVLHFDLVYLALALKELFVGLILGFIIGIPFYIATISGTLIDHQRGSASLLVFNPALQVQASPIGLLYNYITIYLFFTIGGLPQFFDALALAFKVIPPDNWINPYFFAHPPTPFWQAMIGLPNYVLMIATELAAPPLVAIFMSDLFLGIANRMATQVPMSFLGWALKSLAGMAILWLAWGFILQELRQDTAQWTQRVERTLLQMAPPEKVRLLSSASRAPP